MELVVVGDCIMCIKNADFFLVQKCHFYKVHDSNIQLGISDDVQWKDAFIAEFRDNKVVMYHTETANFKGEYTNRELWSQIKLLHTFCGKNIEPISSIEANSILKEYMLDYINNH